MHRDLKLSNVLITPHKKIKIIDLGLAIRLSDLRKENITGCGTPNYIAPEILESKPYDTKADIWSLGCILYTLLTGTPPFEALDVKETLSKIRIGKFNLPKSMSE